MRYAARSVALVVITISLGGPHQSIAQRRRAATSFQGQWVWAVFAKHRSELPPAYQRMKMKDVPESTLELYLKQKGNVLAGDYASGARFLAKVESGSFKTLIRGNSAQVRLESGHGGSVTARITLRGGELYWTLVREVGEHYFPNGVVLTRAPKSASPTTNLKMPH
jgi:hypothetical protein